LCGIIVIPLSLAILASPIHKSPVRTFFGTLVAVDAVTGKVCDLSSSLVSASVCVCWVSIPVGRDRPQPRSTPAPLCPAHLHRPRRWPVGKPAWPGRFDLLCSSTPRPPRCVCGDQCRTSHHARMPRPPSDPQQDSAGRSSPSGSATHAWPAANTMSQPA
jgi:hypothetical protein